MEEHPDLEEIKKFINEEADKYETKISGLEKLVEQDTEEGPSFTLTSGMLDAYMG